MFTFSNSMRRCNHLQGEIEAAYHDAALKFGLSNSTQLILYTLCWVGEPCPLGKIVRITALSKQTVNSALRKMEGQGLIHLTAAGPRAKNVHLTQAGRALAGKTVILLMQAEDEILAEWPQEDVQSYLALTEKFLNGLKEKISRL